MSAGGSHLLLNNILFPFLLGLFSVSAHGAWHSEKAPVMGTQVSVTLWHEDPAKAKSAIDQVMKEMHRVDHALSPYKEASELSRINRLASKKTQSISSELAMLIDKSLYFSRISRGAFDITYASVGRYYDYREKLKPEEKQHQSLLEAINYQHVRLDKKAKAVFFAHPAVYIDLGGIAKGHAVDRAATILQAMGVRHATVSAGGDSRVIGDKRGAPWMIGIKNPRQRDDDPETLIRMPLENVAVSTSGDYERFFIDDKTGERVHHILNPDTGKSAKGVVSVTVLGNQGVDTDPLSTTVFVLGVEKGLDLINRMPGFDCVIIDSKGKAHYSNDLIDPAVK